MPPKRPYGQPEIDEHGGVVSTDSVHHEGHEGNLFEVSYKSPEGADIADNAVIAFLIRVGTVPAHMTLNGACGGDAEVEFFMAPVTSNPGTALTIWNRNHNSNHISKTRVLLGPTVTNDGMRMTNFLIPGGTGPVQSGGGASRANVERILKPSTDYLLRLTNRGGSAQPASLLVDFYEPD